MSSKINGLQIDIKSVTLLLDRQVREKNISNIGDLERTWSAYLWYRLPLHLEFMQIPIEPKFSVGFYVTVNANIRDGNTDRSFMYNIEKGIDFVPKKFS